MSQRSGGKRSKQWGGSSKAVDHHNRSAKNKQQSSGAYHDNPPRKTNKGHFDETKIEDKSHKTASISEAASQVMQEDVGQKDLETASFDSDCNNPECVNIRTKCRKLQAEKEHYIEIIKQLKEELQRLKICQNNAPQEVIEVDISTKHTVASRNAPELAAGPSFYDPFDKGSELAEKNHKPREKAANAISRCQNEESMEQVTNTNCTDNNLEEEKQVKPAGVGIKQSYGDSIDVQTQQNVSWSDEVEDETKNKQSGQQETNRGYAAENVNIPYNYPKENRNEKRQNIYSDARQPTGSYGSGSRDNKSWYGRERGSQHYGERQKWENSQWQGSERRNWRNNQGGEQPVSHSRVLKEIEGDLFTAPKTFSLAHCVAEDMRMGSGIAVTFRQTFKRVDELLAQEARTGEMAVLEHEGRFIYYLVTKKLSNGKPYLNDLKSSLTEMRKHMLVNKVHDVAMPKIGCGRDRLDWWDVRTMLINIFGEDEVNITIYDFTEEQEEKIQQRSSLYIRHVDYSLANIESSTGLLYLGSEDGAVSESLQSLLAKFPILHHYKQATKCVGQFIRTEYKNEVLYGLIIKKKGSDKFSFTTFSQCLKNLKSMLVRKDGFTFAGIDVFPIGGDLQLDTEKLLTTFKNAWFTVHLELYICWPEKYISVYKSCYLRDKGSSN